jgi:hypothetical protein
MAKELKKDPDGRVRPPHSHPEGEERMRPDELRLHLATHHGWTTAMFRKGRADGEEGVRYMEGWHRNDHVPMAKPR